MFWIMFHSLNAEICNVSSINDQIIYIWQVKKPPYIQGFEDIVNLWSHCACHIPLHRYSIANITVIIMFWCSSGSRNYYVNCEANRIIYSACILNSVQTNLVSTWGFPIVIDFPYCHRFSEADVPNVTLLLISIW